MKLRLADEISSMQDLKTTIMDVHSYAKWFNQASIKNTVAGTGMDTQPPMPPVALDLVQQWHEGSKVSRQSLDELIRTLEDFVQRAPRISITLAGPAPGSLRKELVSWCRKNIDGDILIDFKFNSTMLGGMILRYGSHVYDWSFRSQILAARDKFPEILRHV